MGCVSSKKTTDGQQHHPPKAEAVASGKEDQVFSYPVVGVKTCATEPEDSPPPLTGPFYFIKNLQSSKNMNVEDKSYEDGAKIIQYGSDEENSQWQLVNVKTKKAEDPQDGETYYIQNRFSGKLLNDPNNTTKQYVQFQQWSWLGGENPASQWSLLKREDGGYIIQNQLSQGWCIVKDNSLQDGAVVWGTNEGKYEDYKSAHWKLESPPNHKEQTFVDVLKAEQEEVAEVLKAEENKIADFMKAEEDQLADILNAEKAKASPLVEPDGVVANSTCSWFC